MKNKLSVKVALTIALLAMLATGVCIWASHASSNSPAGTRHTISDSERAMDTLEVQNTMSKHAYYHAAGLQMQELADIWVSEDGAFAKSATFSNPTWIMDGLSVVKQYYGQGKEDRRVAALKALSEIYPNVKNVKENMGAGDEWVIHTQTTPIIEIAGDGKTAKGVWYSPGIGLMPTIKDGIVTMNGTMFWEKYGVDFAKENGEWKIWHMQMFYDYTPKLDGKWTEIQGTGSAAAMAKGQVQEGEKAQALRPGTKANPYSYPAYSPSRASVIAPKFPQRYYTFSETFSY